MDTEQKKQLSKLLLSTVLLILLELLLHFFEVGKWVKAVLYLAPYLVVGADLLKEAAEGIMNREIFDEEFLMAVATVGAIALGEYREAVAVVIFFRIGELFESAAVEKSRKNISELMDIRPDYANALREGKAERVNPSELVTGEIIIVNPGERIPVDGIITEGNTTLDTSALTGESIPQSVYEGDDVLSGCINISSMIKLRTTKEFGESTASKILELVENAGSRKSKSENFISRFAHVYTPIVCLCALALAVLPPVAGLIAGRDANLSQWLYRALSFLVISCPCALVISIPLSFFAGIGGAGRAGILVKGSNYLEALAFVKQAVFDKTGTLTHGVFEVTGIAHNTLEEEKLLEIAAHVEAHSSHPIAKSILSAYGGPIDEARVSDIYETGGLGISAAVDGKCVVLGNEKLMKSLGVSCQQGNYSGTVVHVAIDGVYAGQLLISDKIKEGAKKAMEDLKKAGITKTVMLTGDSDRVARQVAEELRLDEIHSELMPADKVEWMERLMTGKSEKEKLAFVGDGINDAPVLARADIGIAMGALGSDAAIEAADVVLMDDDPRKLVKAMEISRKCLRIVYENICLAIGVKTLCLVLGAIGITNMWMAIFADVGVMVIAVLNALRAFKVR